MKNLKLFFFSFSLFVLFSCAIHSGNMSSSAAISNANFRVVNNVTATAKASYFLGIGGLKKQGLMLEAKKELYTKYPLKKGQVYANLSIDYKTSFFYIYHEVVATVNADIVDFNEEVFLDDTTTDKSSIGLQNTAFNKEEDFKVNETVKFSANGIYKTGKVLELNPKTAKVSDYETGIEYTKSKNNLFKSENTGNFGNGKLTPGDSIEITRPERTLKGIVVALGKTAFLAGIPTKVDKQRIIMVQYNSGVYKLLKK